jgi:ABC-type multidrug transport system fused ATPase/permease subunit
LPSEPSTGCIDLEAVWLDDRRRCRWALRGLDLTLLPGSLVALLGPPDDGGADAVLDLVAGRRLPDKGSVRIDGIDLRDLDRAAHRRAVVELELLPGGERRLCLTERALGLPNATMLAVRPTPVTIRAADEVVVIEDGLLRRSRSGGNGRSPKPGIASR